MTVGVILPVHVEQRHLRILGYASKIVLMICCRQIEEACSPPSLAGVKPATQLPLLLVRAAIAEYRARMTPHCSRSTSTSRAKTDKTRRHTSGEAGQDEVLTTSSQIALYQHANALYASFTPHESR